MSGMNSCDAAEPRLAQPAETALARATTERENMELIQYWLDTKAAREKPERKRRRRKEAGEEAVAARRKTAGAERMVPATNYRVWMIID